MTRLEFPAKTRDQAIQRAKGRCQACGLPFGGKKVEIDHLLPCALGGLPTLANARAICAACHKAKTAKDIRGIRKSDRQRRAHIGAKAAPKRRIESPPFQRTEKPKPVKLPVPPPRNLYVRMK